MNYYLYTKDSPFAQAAVDLADNLVIGCHVWCAQNGRGSGQTVYVDCSFDANYEETEKLRSHQAGGLTWLR